MVCMGMLPKTWRSGVMCSHFRSCHDEGANDVYPNKPVTHWNVSEIQTITVSSVSKAIVSLSWSPKIEAAYYAVKQKKASKPFICPYAIPLHSTDFIMRPSFAYACDCFMIQEQWKACFRSNSVGYHRYCPWQRLDCDEWKKYASMCLRYVTMLANWEYYYTTWKEKVKQLHQGIFICRLADTWWITRYQIIYRILSRSHDPSKRTVCLGIALLIQEFE